MDQAQKLREFKARASRKSSTNDHTDDARIITVASGKGGVGKTSFTVNLSMALAKLGKKVCIIDADLGLANVDVMFGLVSRYNISHVLNGERKVQDCITKGPHGIQIVSGGSGIMDLVNLKEEQIQKMISALDYFNSTSDYIIIDTGAGISPSILSFIDAASDVILVITPDPTSITDAYALIKNIPSDDERKIKLVINRVENKKEGMDVFNKLQLASNRFLNKELENFGYVFEDDSLRKAVRKQKTLLEAFPHSISSRSIENIALSFVNNGSETKKTFRSFIDRLFNKI